MVDEQSDGVEGQGAGDPAAEFVIALEHGDLLASLADQVLVLGPAGELRYVNWVIPGVSLDEVIGRCWLDFVPVSQREVAEGARLRCLREQTPQLYELMARGADGGVSWYRSHIAPLRHAGGGTVVVAAEMTGAKLAEAELLAADRQRSLATLSSSLSHEIKNPLASLLASLEVIEREHAPLLEATPGLAASLADVRRSALRIDQVATDVLMFAGADGQETDDADVNLVCASVLRAVANWARHRARVTHELSPNLRCSGRPSQLWQVLLSLVQNSVEALPLGAADKHHITLRALRVGDRVRFEVQDDGKGILPELEPLIGQPFFSTKDAASGVGLGLTLGQRLVIKMGGSLDFERGREAGALFFFELPAVEPKQVELSKGPAARRARILLIDDEKVLAHAMGRILSRDHECVVETRAEAALARVAAGEGFDIVFCDVMMPMMSGPEFHQALVQLDPELAQRLVFLSGGAFAPEARRYLDQVSNLWLDKPVRVARILELVVAALQKNENAPAARAAAAPHS